MKDYQTRREELAVAYHEFQYEIGIFLIKLLRALKIMKPLE